MRGINVTQIQAYRPKSAGNISEGRKYAVKRGKLA
jgi:hypothetical protein